MYNRLKIILDTDPGGDDIFALLWILSLVKQGFMELVAVTTAQGNVNANVTFECASQVLGLTGFAQIEIGKGVIFTSAEIEDAAYIHGVDGMGGLAATLPAGKHKYSTAPTSDDLIIEKLNAEPGEITLIAIAPLTNLAAAETKSPGILKKAKEIIIMGGAFRVSGNVTSHAEFNIGFNAEAAKVVFNSRNDIVILPLDITSQLIFTPEMAKDVSQVNPQNPIAKFILELNNFLTESSLNYRQTEGIKGFLVHDAATIAYLCYPETLLLQRARVEVETQGTFTNGQTIFDDRHYPKTNPNAWVSLQVDEANLLASLVEDLKVLILGEN
ncbi:nucleoside hydrolase [Brunnivagina elsteri CCALA 953]|uniref:Nucleoside hydrolase n=2 Tax=Brunnivagina TaxID=3344733 RepID=A0A2A2TP02_9CYAN|nr:nucleoside hydrolase [Calothrix elsteri CCALA 953]